MTHREIAAALLLLLTTVARASAQEVALILRVADGPHSGAPGELPPFQVQLVNFRSAPITYVSEGLIHSDIEIDGVWHSQAWAGSCCSGPVRIPAGGGKSALMSFRVTPSLTFAQGETPARQLDLRPGRHVIRVRSLSRDNIAVRGAADTPTLTSNPVTVDIPVRATGFPREPVAAPACQADAGRRFAFFAGAVEKGQVFSRGVEGGWFVRLDSTESGWTLRVTTNLRVNEDLSRLTTPFSSTTNPRFIEGWHFRNADNTAVNDGSVNAPGVLREFIFSPEVGQSIGNTGSAITSGDIERVRAYGRGWLFLDSYRLSAPSRGERASFEAITFRGCLIWQG